MGRRAVRERAATACALTLAALATVSAVAGATLATGAGAAPARARAAERFACSTPSSATRPCYFSTPSGDVHCEWTPKPNSVVCELLAIRRAYRLNATGHGKSVHASLTRRGETLPTNQLLSFPEKLSCQDTKTAMTCNQDEGFGEFKLSPHGSHAAAVTTAAAPSA